MQPYLKTVVYSSEPSVRKPWKLMHEMVDDLLASRELAWCLLVRNIRVQYRQTLLGYMWAFLPPLFMTVIWVLLISQKVFTVDNPGMPYPLFVLTGMVLWQTFIDAINSPLKIVTESKSMLTKINFPRESLILAGLGEVLFNFMVRLLILVPCYIYYEYSLPGTVFIAPAGVLSLIVMGLMIGLLLTPIGILYGDIGRGIMLVTQAWFFLTPVIYPVTDGFPATYLIELNPVTPILVTTRDWITTGGTYLLPEFILISLINIALLFVGWVSYRLAMPHLTSRISA